MVIITLRPTSPPRLPPSQTATWNCTCRSYALITHPSSTAKKRRTGRSLHCLPFEAIADSDHEEVRSEKTWEQAEKWAHGKWEVIAPWKLAPSLALSPRESHSRLEKKRSLHWNRSLLASPPPINVWEHHNHGSFCVKTATPLAKSSSRETEHNHKPCCLASENTSARVCELGLPSV